tara:strand:+ start:5541 stop:5720 length:180 start_codon:yes stop_codon:yes gene_type:complete
VHELKVLVGTQKYVDWPDHEIVRRLEKLCFDDGSLFSKNISSIATELADSKKLGTLLRI